MDVKKLAQDLIPLVGGKDNIRGVLHCMTRLRFQLADMSKAKIAEIEALDGVMGVKEVGAQTQVIIGPNVAAVYKEVKNIVGDLRRRKSGPGRRGREAEAQREASGHDLGHLCTGYPADHRSRYDQGHPRDHGGAGPAR